MEILASIGVFTLIFIILYFYLNGIDNKEYERKENWELSKFDDDCIDLKRSIGDGAEFQTAIKKILSDPVKRYAAIQKMKEKKLIDEQEKERFRNEMAKNRKFGYKYEEMIFDIFDNYRKLSKNDIIWCMENYYSFNKLEAKSVFNLWIENQLLNKDYHNDGFFQIGSVLIFDLYKSTQDDITRDEWLKLHNKELQPIGSEYNFFKYKHFICLNTYTIEEAKSIFNTKELRIKELEPGELSVLDDNNEIVGILCSANKPLEQMTKPVISLIQPVIHQANGNFVADITQKPIYLLHQLGAIKSNIILAPF